MGCCAVSKRVPPDGDECAGSGCTIEIGDLCAGSGCTIEKTEERGITLQQLKRVLAHISRRCEPEGWISSKRANPEALTPLAVNLYDAVHFVLKPATEAKRCSYVELVADAAQIPAWFVSHWWGEPVSDFVTCVSRHRADRRLPEDSPYWVCAYANNQWALGSENLTDPSQSSFKRAMSRASGTLTIVDRGAVTFQRIWCGFEIYTSLAEGEDGEAPYMYDLYMATSGFFDAVGITDGVAPVDLVSGEENAIEAKAYRESFFPAGVAARALAIRIEHGQASVDMDRVRILNTITGAKDLEMAPLAEHEMYDAINRKLWARCAVATWRSSLEAELSIEVHSKALAQSSLTRLDLNFQLCSSFTEEAAQLLAAGLPKKLQSLKIDFMGCKQLTDNTVQVVAGALPETLRELRLEFAACKALSDVSVSAIAASLLHPDQQNKTEALQRLFLNFAHDRLITDASVQELATRLPQSLVDLTLNFGNCPNLTDGAVRALVARVAQIQAAPQAHYACSLIFAGCQLQSAGCVDGSVAPPHLQLLLERQGGEGPDPTQYRPRLVDAAVHGRMEPFYDIGNYDWEVNIGDLNHALCAAIKSEQPKIVDYLMETEEGGLYADPEFIDPETQHSLRDLGVAAASEEIRRSVRYIRSLSDQLLQAVDDNDEERLVQLLQNKFTNVNAYDGWGCAFARCARPARPRLLRKLLQHPDADPSGSPCSWAPLRIAEKDGNQEIVDMLTVWYDSRPAQ